MSPNGRACSNSSFAAIAAAVLLLVALLASLAAAGPADARVHTFKELRGKSRTTKAFRLVGIDAKAIVQARLVAPSGHKRLSVAAVRKAARSRKRILRVRTRPIASSRRTARASRTAALKVTTAPDTTITGGPAEGSQTTSTSATFSFGATTGGKTSFYCSLDGAPAQRCSSGVSYSGLASGTHRFSVYAVDRYGTADPTPAQRNWTVVSPSDPDPAPAPAPDGTDSDSGTGGDADATAPDTAITAGPADGSSTTSTSASFGFAGTDDRGMAGYECSLDGAAFATCTSPKAYSGLSLGPHTFRVRARDAAGNVDLTPAVRAWTVAAATPTYQVPSSVPAGCISDATSQILSWIASVPNNSTLTFAAGACYRIEGTLELRNRQLTIDGNGATFRSLNAPTSSRAIWRGWDSMLTLRNMTIDGSYASGGVFADTLQHAHAIDLRGTHGVVQNVHMTDLAGDCVYFGLGARRSSGSVRDSSCRGISRNAVSITAAEDVRVERMTTDRIGYIAFDVEPNTGAGFGAARIVFDSNTIGSYYMKAFTIIGNAPVSDIAFTNNRVVGQGLKIGAVNRTHRPQAVRISGNSTDTPTAPSAMNLDGISGLSVTGNTVPMTGGTMASVDSSCEVVVSGNSYPGGSREAYITNPVC